MACETIVDCRSAGPTALVPSTATLQQMRTSFLSTFASTAKPWQRWRCCAAHIVAIDQCTMQDVGVLRALSKSRCTRIFNACHHYPAVDRTTEASQTIQIFVLVAHSPLSEPENFPFRQVLRGEVFRLSHPDAPIAFP